MCIIFDLCKAFDSVPNRVLLQKIQSSGINKWILNWLFSYLYDRKQYVVLTVKILHLLVFCLVFHKDQYWVPFCFLIK